MPDPRCLVWLFILLTLPGTSSAQESIYDQCLAAIEARDLQDVVQFSDAIRRFNSHPASKIQDAIRCVSEAEGIPMVLSESGRIVTLEEQEFERQAFEARAREIEQQRIYDLEREEEASRLKAINSTLIARDVYLACLELFESDFVAAMTNSVCINSFETNLHPNLSNVAQD